MIQLEPKLAIPLEKLWKEYKGQEYAQYTPHALADIPKDLNSVYWNKSFVNKK